MKWVLTAAMFVVSIAFISAAQSPKNQAIVFAVKGKVVNEKGTPASFAWICLEETRSRIFRMKRAGREGDFSFTSLNVRFDYQIYAERDGVVSNKVAIAGFQRAPEITIKLKLNANQEQK